MKKTTAEIEIPKGVTDQVFRLLLEDVAKAIKTARALRKERVTVRIDQGE